MAASARAERTGGAAAAAVALSCLGGCRDLSAFKANGDRFEGAVVQADFVRAGVASGTTLCLTLDTDHLQDAPGAISTSDGRFHATALRPIPQIWHDPLSTLNFGEGRLQNLLYVARGEAPLSDGGPSMPPDASDAGDVFVVVSLLQAGGIEVRLLRSAPPGASPAPIFALFELAREKGPCSY